MTSTVRCGACGLQGEITRQDVLRPIDGSPDRVVRLVRLYRRADWETPVWRCVLSGTRGAIALVCLRCICAGKPIREAIEESDAGPRYHAVQSLRKTRYVAC